MILRKIGYDFLPGEKETMSSYEGVGLGKMAEDPAAPVRNILVYMECDHNLLELYVINADDTEVENIKDSLAHEGNFMVADVSDRSKSNIRHIMARQRPAAERTGTRPTQAEKVLQKKRSENAGRIAEILRPLVKDLKVKQKVVIRPAEPRRIPGVNIKRIFQPKDEQTRQR